MNPGYLSLLMLCITLILLASGWKDELVRGISHKVILLFFIGWIVFSFFHISLLKVTFNLSYLLLVAVVFGIFFTCRSSIQAFHLASVGFLLGSFHFLLQQLYSTDPIMIVYHPLFDTSFSLSILAAVLVRHPLQQIASITIGLMLGDIGFHYFNQGFIPLHFGHATFQDQWWLTILLARFLSFAFSYMLKGFKGIVQLWYGYRKGWRR